MGSRTKGKKKPKSYKAKITSKMGSKRRAQRMGKELKKGQKGAAASFITRARVLRRLQISLKDFRRLCILKGVYPRDPSKKAAGKDKTYYHIKDVAFLSHEPLIEHFRAFKAFMKKIRRTVGRGETADARRRELRAKPTYTLNHLVKERYPRFIDAVRDLDDALSLVHLFASLPQVRAATGERTQTCMRLVREWQLYCSKAGCLNKVFVSIKGVYFQCEVVGQPVTWIAPHSFSQHYPHDVDFSIMLTFLEFYEVLLKFVMFRLYSSLGLRYPPLLNDTLDELDAGFLAARPQAKDAPMNAAPGEENDSYMEPAAALEQQKRSEKNIRTLDRKIEQVMAVTADRGDMEDDGGEDGDGELGDALTVPLGEALMSAGDAPGQDSKFSPDDESDRRPLLFRGLRFFLGREVPKHWVAFTIISCGGEVGWDGPGSPFSVSDSSITHQVVDRPQFAPTQCVAREYIQPQWIFDSINVAARLPVERYAAGASLPPHLSPFVDDSLEGYVPEYREELRKVQNSVAPGSAPAANESESMDSESEDEEDEETVYARELEQESKGVNFSHAVDDVEESDDDDEEEKDEEEDGEKQKQRKAKKGGDTDKLEIKELAHSVMSKKAKRLYDRMQHGISKKRTEIERLKSKRQAIDAKYAKPEGISQGRSKRKG